MAARKKAAGPTPVTATRHSDTRVNIPTSELSDFFADDEQQPDKTLYPRDQTLDLQLVWKGKDEQDLAEYLRVASVPVYIQEKVDPRALIENLRQTAAPGEDEPELRLFDDFDGLEFDELVDFYVHDGNWSNRMILGDSLLVMTADAVEHDLGPLVDIRDDNGFTRDRAFVCRPRSLLVAGRLHQFLDGDHVDPPMFESFERFPRSLVDPEIVTFDELLDRARFAVHLAEESGE